MMLADGLCEIADPPKACGDGGLRTNDDMVSDVFPL